MDYKPRGDRAASSAAGGAGREVAAAEAAKRSVRENRVYVGNLSFQVRWNDLKDFMREGEGSFSDCWAVAGLGTKDV